MSEAVPTSSLIVLSIPIFIALMAIEMALDAAVTKRGLYRLGDSIGNLACGILEQVQVIFLKSVLIVPYVLFWQFASTRGWTLTWSADSRLAQFALWTLAFVGVDFCYYWWHRLGHEVNVLWAAHAIHHQSEDYNLSVALRQGSLSDFTNIPFYLPLVFLGVSPIVFVTAKAAMILYQFWIHTQLVPKLGVIEKVFNTPSHHRVHHGINPEYIDKNYAGTLIIWDRMFGTFEEERRPVVYGVVKPLRTHNPFWANVQVLLEIAEIGRLRAWFARPGWRPAEQGGPLRPPEVSRETFRKFEPAVSPRARGAALGIFVLTLALAAGFLLGFDSLDETARVACAAGVLAGLAATAVLLRDGRDGRGNRA